MTGSGSCLSRYRLRPAPKIGCYLPNAFDETDTEDFMNDEVRRGSKKVWHWGERIR